MLELLTGGAIGYLLGRGGRPIAADVHVETHGPTAREVAMELDRIQRDRVSREAQRKIEAEHYARVAEKLREVAVDPSWDSIAAEITCFPHNSTEGAMFRAIGRFYEYQPDTMRFRRRDVGGILGLAEHAERMAQEK